MIWLCTQNNLLPLSWHSDDRKMIHDILNMGKEEIENKTVFYNSAFKCEKFLDVWTLALKLSAKP